MSNNSVNERINRWLYTYLVCHEALVRGATDRVLASELVNLILRLTHFGEAVTINLRIQEALIFLKLIEQLLLQLV